MSKESVMSKMGDKQGNMSPHVADYQRPASNFSQHDLNMTTQYIERQNKHVAKECSEIKKQSYQGRYS